MPFCTKCGAEYHEGDETCLSCNQPLAARVPPVEETPESVSEPRESTVAAEPVAAPEELFTDRADGSGDEKKRCDQRPPKGSPYAPMGIWSYLWTFALLAVPVVGFVFLVVWACGGCSNYNRRSFARAALIVCLVGILLCVVAAVVVIAVGRPFIKEIVDVIKRGIENRSFSIDITF